MKNAKAEAKPMFPGSQDDPRWLVTVDGKWALITVHGDDEGNAKLAAGAINGSLEAQEELRLLRNVLKAALTQAEETDEGSELYDADAHRALIRAMDAYTKRYGDPRVSK